MMEYAVRCVNVGVSELRGPEVFWMSHWDEWLPLQFYTVLIQGNGITALVNTSPPYDLERVHAEFPTLDWALPEGTSGRVKRSEDQFILPALARVGVNPADVTHVFLTPLELYTIGTLMEFPNAQICIAKRGWIHFHTTHEHPHDKRWRSIPRDTLVHLVTDAWDRVRLLEDEDEIAPGLRTWWCGVHHRESIVVEIDTPAGTVCTSDSFFYFENIEQNRILGLCENMYEALAAYDRVRRTADLIIPSNDAKVFERYADGIVARLEA